MINRVSISLLIMRGKISNTSNISIRLLYLAISLIVLTIIYKRISLITA